MTEREYLKIYRLLELLDCILSENNELDEDKTSNAWELNRMAMYLLNDCETDSFKIVKDDISLEDVFQVLPRVGSPIEPNLNCRCIEGKKDEK